MEKERHQSPATPEEIWAILHKIAARQEEFDRRMEKQQRKADQEYQREKKIAKQRINKLEELFTTQWGKLVESLVEGDLHRLLNDWGIVVHDTAERRKGKLDKPLTEQYEFDIIATNGEDIVVVEVKTTLRVKHVKEFLWELEQFTEWLPEYRDRRVYGAVAYIKVVEEAEKYATRQGLFVIRATGSSASIINPAGFKPKRFDTGADEC